MTRRSDVLLAVSVLAVAVSVRLAPLALSPLPYNTDAYVFVRNAELIREANGVAFSGPTAPYPDEYLFDTLLAALSDATGIAPLALVQGFVAVVGAIPPLVAAALGRTLALSAGLTRVRARLVGLLAGLGLAVEGLYLWRTLTISSEVMGLAVVALVVLAAHRSFTTARPAWLGLAVGFGVLLPIVHNGSTFVGGLVVSVLVVLHVARDPTLRRIVLGGLAVLGFWTVAFGYYAVVDLPDASDVSAAPGLFVAWGVLFALVGRWADTTSRLGKRALPIAAVGVGFLAFLANALVPVFPGSATTSPVLLALVVPLLVLVALAADAFPDATTRRGLVALALFLGPVAAVGFAMTAGRTLDYQGLATRSQTFAHLAVLVLAALATVRLASSRGSSVARVGVVALFVGAVVASAPLPFVLAGAGATPFQAVTSPAEFETAMFATEHVPGRWAADDHVTHVGGKYRGAPVTDLPVFTWLGGADPPGCPTVGQRSWTTTGAPAFPEPLSISRGAYERWYTVNDAVYATTGGDPLVLVLGDGAGTCEPAPTSPRGAR
ncbi:hypothetical protein [Halomarina litorea]|uniref:hypothetical protein n=1 Tax=Halomarina litorea TaxID=2961595 RepID=UPI0020C507E0|nr:hypothetical protein [Halomarina sp. BCD28]